MKLWDFIVLISLTGMLIGLVAISAWTMVNVDSINKKYAALITLENESDTHVWAELVSVRSSHGSRITYLETNNKQLNAADLRYQQALTDLTLFSQNISNMNAQLVNLTAAQKTMLAMIVRYQFESSEIYENTTNHSKPLITNDMPAYLQIYKDLQCYKDIRASGFGRFVDPEWLCNAGQALPEYAPYVRPACACAREACSLRTDMDLNTCLNSLPP